jgi:predicted TIM-barrel fold metal-dependent hydrolase
VTERLISADSHVQLSHDQVKERLDPVHHAAYDGAVQRFYEHLLATMGPGVVRPQSLDDYSHPAAGRPGHADAAARLDDMDTDGVDAEVVYCEVSAFRYLYMVDGAATEATRAFNDALAAYGDVDPKRLIVTYQIPIQDIDAAVAEVRRVAAMGGKSIQLPVFPTEVGCPDYYDERYDPLWRAISDTGLPICCHIGLNTSLDDLARRDPTPQRGVMVPMVGLSTAEAFGMWVMGGVFERFPDLKVVFVEPGLGWVAWWLFIVDDMATRQRYEFPAISNVPSHYFHRNVFLTFIDEPDALQLLRHRLGVENLLWSTDYPHPVSTWPNSRTIVAEQFAGIPAPERELMLSGNAIRVWNL